MTDEKTTRGAGLTRATVLAAALEIADAEGLGALSFRRLAAHFDVTPMALYRYVANKEALLDGLGDIVLSELELPEQGDWDVQLRSVARSFRACLTSHPAAIPIFLSRPLFTPAATRTADAMLGILSRAGFAPEQAVLLYPHFARFLIALVMVENEGRADSPEDQSADKMRVAREAFETLSPDEYPHLVEAVPLLVRPNEPDTAFESGLALLIAGLDGLRPKRGKSGRSARATSKSG